MVRCAQRFSHNFNSPSYYVAGCGRGHHHGRAMWEGPGRRESRRRRVFCPSKLWFLENLYIGFCIFKRTDVCDKVIPSLHGDPVPPSLFSGPSRYAHSNRSAILLRSIKKNHRGFLKTQKVRDCFRRKVFDYFQIFDFTQTLWRRESLYHRHY